MDSMKNEVVEFKNIDVAESVEIVNKTTNDNTWAVITETLAKSFDHNADSVLDVSKEAAAIKSLSPDDPYRQMIQAVYQDEKLTLPEKTDQVLRILRQRMEDQKSVAEIVERIQTKKADNFEKVSRGHSQWASIVFGGALIVFFTLTPGGRNLAKRGIQFMAKGLAA